MVNKMNKTMEILREMLNAGIIDIEEYEAERNHYSFIINSVHEFNERILEKKTQLESKNNAEKHENSDQIEKLFRLVADGIISVDEFRKAKEDMNDKKRI